LYERLNSTSAAWKTSKICFVIALDEEGFVATKGKQDDEAAANIA